MNFNQNLKYKISKTLLELEVESPFSVEVTIHLQCMTWNWMVGFLPISTGAQTVYKQFTKRHYFIYEGGPKVTGIALRWARLQ